MASATTESTSEGEVVTFGPTEFVYACNNESLAAGKRNHMKNPNAFDPVIAKSFADSVYSCGAMSETTFMILSPAKKKWGTCTTWLEHTREALKLLPDGAGVSGEMESRIATLLEDKRRKPTWNETIKATLWNYDAHGLPTNEGFNNARPEFVSVQGQHRAAVLNAAFANDLGLSLSRGGDLNGGLFTDDDGATKLCTLKENLQNMKISVNVYDFLTHDQAEEAGRRQRTAEQTTTDVTFLDVARSQGDLVRQVFNPKQKICRRRAKEAFGEDWRVAMETESMKAEQKRIRRGLVTRVNSAMRAQLGLSIQGKPSFAVFVYALALDPERPSLQLLIQYLNDQNAKVVKAKAAKVKSLVRASKLSAGQGSADDGDNASCTGYTPHSITVTALGAFFSLTPYSQDTQTVKDLLMEKGLTEGFRKDCYAHFVVLEVVRAMVKGLVTRINCVDDPHPFKESDTVIPVPTETSELFSILKTFVSEEEGAAVAAAGGAFISSMYQEVDFWVPHLVRFLLKGKGKNGRFISGDFKVTKCALAMSSNRRTTAFRNITSDEMVNPSNKSNLTPAWGTKPFMSTSGTEPDFTQRTWQERFTFKSRTDTEFEVSYIHRMVATVFGLLIADRCLVGLSSGQQLEGRRAKFPHLLGAIPAVGDGQKIKAFLKDQKAVAAYLQVEDQSFFAEDRLVLLFGGDQALGGESVKPSAERKSSDYIPSSDSDNGESTRDVDGPARKRGSKEPEEQFEVSIIRDCGDNDASEVSVFWPESVVSQLSMLDEKGELKCSDGIFRFNIEKKAT
ncbi:unnamed protein product [Ectocarpus fasciculatus]